MLAPTQAGPLQPTVFSHRQRVAIAHDDMVQHPHIHHVQRLLQQLGQFSISRAGLRAPRRVVVAQDQRRRVVRQGALDHLSRIDNRSVDGALGNDLEPQHPMHAVTP